MSSQFPVPRLPHHSDRGNCRCIVRAFWLKVHDASCTIDARPSHPQPKNRDSTIKIQTVILSPHVRSVESPHAISCLIPLLNIHDAMHTNERNPQLREKKKIYPADQQRNEQQSTSHSQECPPCLLSGPAHH